MPENAVKFASRTQTVLRRYRARNMIVGGSLIAGVAGVYAYTILQVKQEDFSEYDNLPRQTKA